MIKMTDEIKEQREKIKTGVGIMILKNGKVLLGKRNESKTKPDSSLKGHNTWTMPGGKIEFGESFEETAIREVEEETGIKLEEVKVICVNNDKTDTVHFITIGLQAEETEQEPKVIEPITITDWQWFDLDNLPSPLYSPSKNIIENYKQNKFYLEKPFTRTHTAHKNWMDQEQSSCGPRTAEGL